MLTALAQYRQEVQIALISVLAFCILGLIKKRSLLHYLVVCIPYILVIYYFLRSPTLPPDGDTYKNFFREFNYLANAVASTHFLPAWFPSCGGIRAGFFHIISAFTLPNRIFGYYFYAVSPGNIMLAYKLQYAAGMILACFGWWLVLRKLTGSLYAAFFGTLMILMGGTGTAFYQEQVVATIYLIPWFVLSIMKIRDDSLYIFPAAALFGLSLNTHLPQIHMISCGLFVLAAVLAGWGPLKKLHKERKRSLPLLCVLFILAILPTIYLVLNLHNLSSAHRASEKIFPQTYQEYLDTNSEGYSSAIPEYFMQYIKPVYWGPVDAHPRIPPLDCQAFYVGRASFLLILIALALSFRKALPALLLLIAFSMITLGKNSPLPVLKFFYVIHFPFIRIFREWYHFFPMVNFCLSALAALGVAALARLCDRNRITKIVFFIIIVPLLLIHITDLVYYHKRWASTYFAAPVVWDDLSNFNTIGAREGCGSGFFIQYKNRFRLSHAYPLFIPSRAFITTRVSAQEGGADKEFEKVGLLAAAGETDVVVNAPADALEGLSAQGEALYSEGKASLNYEGLSFEITAPKRCLLVTPLNYDLGVNGSVDGKKVRVFRVNSALCGVFLEKGHHGINLKVAPDAYVPITLIQMLLYLFLALFFIFKYMARDKLPADH